MFAGRDNAKIEIVCNPQCGRSGADHAGVMRLQCDHYQAGDHYGGSTNHHREDHRPPHHDGPFGQAPVRRHAHLIPPTNYTIFGAAVSNRPGGTPAMWEQITTPTERDQVAGGGTADYGDGPTSMKDVIGCLAEKWSTPDQYTWVLDIRKGVRFAKDSRAIRDRISSTDVR